MGRRVHMLVLVGALLATALPASTVQATTSCPPITLDDLFPGDTTTPAETIPPTAEGDSAATPQVSCRPFVYRMLWPILGESEVISVFGADRDGGSRHHAGVDIGAAKMSVVVAVKGGVVSEVRDVIGSGDCCWLGIRHNDGWSSLYLHLNNDVYGTDDGAGSGVRPDLSVGMQVRAGEVIGWVGDSGNAEPSTPHLHFELHRPDGTAVDPLYSLWAGHRRAQPSLTRQDDFRGPFLDDEGTAAEPLFSLLTSRGIALACDGWGAAVCPHQLASRSDAAAWISVLSGVSVPETPPTAPVTLTVPTEEASVCLMPPCLPTITNSEVYILLVWAEDQRSYQEAMALVTPGVLPPPELTPPSDPSALNPSYAFSRLVVMGRLDACPFMANPLEAPVSRGWLARLLARAFGYLPAVPCDLIA